MRASDLYSYYITNEFLTQALCALIFCPVTCLLDFGEQQVFIL